MLLHATFRPIGESLDESEIWRSFASLLTLAISLHDLPSSRICFNLCSSAAVHGVLVRLLFFALSSDSNDGIETLVLLGSAAVGGRISKDGLAALFRGLVGDKSGGGAVSRVVGGEEMIDDGGGSSIGLGGEALLEALVRGRLAGGGVLRHKVNLLLQRGRQVGGRGIASVV